MRIEYKILWIDDAPEWVTSKLDGVSDYLNDFGFKLEPEIKDKYDPAIDFSKYDIIAVDYDLGSETGTKSIQEIRHQKIYTEILFYSTNGEPALRTEMQNNKVDGVYCANRDDSIDRLKNLIYTTIRKTQEINNLRGLVMSETSELDAIVKRILLKDKWDEPKSRPLVKKLEEKHIEKGDFLKTHTSPINMPVLINDVHFFHAMFAFSALKKVLEDNIWEEIKEYKELIEIRNVLAHGKELSTTADEIILEKITSSGKTEPVLFKSDDFIKIRKRICEFRDKFEACL